MGVQTEAEQRTGAPGTPAAFGTLFEPAARLAYEAKTGYWVEEVGFWVSDEHPWLGSSVDGLIGKDGALECKAPEFCSHKILPCYRIQCLIVGPACLPPLGDGNQGVDKSLAGVA